MTTTSIRTQLLLLFISIPILVNSQTHNTVASGDIQSASVWQDGIVPAFNEIAGDLEVPVNLVLNITHELTTSKNEVLNRGSVRVSLDDLATPTIHWRNFGDLTLGGAGWALMDDYFINETTGRMLFKPGGSFCHQFGCGSENFGTIYIRQCTSNMCAIDSTSRFVNHESGKIILCGADGYMENYWYNPTLGSSSTLANLRFINNGAIIFQSSDNFIHYEGNDFFNGNPFSMGEFVGDTPYLDAGVECVTELASPGSSGVAELTASIILEIFPNPTISGNVTILTDLDYDFIQVVSALGQVVQEFSASELSLSNSIQLPPAEGLYFISFVKNDRKIAQEKVLLIN